MGIAFNDLLGGRGMGEFRGRSPGLGLIGNPGLSNEGAVLLFASEDGVLADICCRTMVGCSLEPSIVPVAA